MNISKIIDLLQKLINSVLFRLVLITYAILILFVFNNFLDFYVYIIIIASYIFIYFSLLKNSYLRLINDFIFIGLIILNKNPNDVLLFVFIILPIINSVNFSGQKKSFLLYVITTITYILLLCNFNYKYDIDFIGKSLYPILGIFFLWVINGYTSLRTKIRSFRDELNDVVDSFHIEKEYLQRPHRIYKSLISVINKNIKSNLIEEIFCFVISDNSNSPLTIVNSSKFIWKHELNEEGFIEKIRKRTNLINQNITIENEVKDNNIVIYSKVEEYEYVFFIIISMPIPFYYQMIGIFRTLEPAFVKISNVLMGEKKIQELRSEEIARLSERSQYVNRANKTMHFMRNRLGPFANLIKQLDGFETISEEKREKFKKLIFKEKDRAKIELLNITKRADNMLEKSTNPFSYTETKQISIERTFTILKHNVSIFFPESIIVVDVIHLENKRYVVINEEGFEMFLSDWLSNISKYNNKIIDFKFSLDNKYLTINFINNHKLSDDEIQKLISDLTSDDRNEIMKRTTHGLFLIKSTLEEMNISFNVTHNNDDQLLTLQLKLKTKENEDSNI
jgi:hypothetical protein